MSYFTKIFQQTFWQVLGKIITSLSTFIILGLVTRNYGENGTGVFTLALTYLAMFYLLSDFGFNAHVLRNLKTQSSRPEDDGPLAQKIKIEWQKLLGTRILWSATLAIASVALLPFLPFAAADFTRAVFFGSLAIIASGVFVTCNLIFQSKLRYDLSILASSLGTILGLVIFVYLSFFKFPIPFLLLAHLIGWIVIALVATLLVLKFFQNVIPIFDKQYTVSLFKQSWPIAATLSLNVLYFRADSFMVAYFKSVSEAGVYNVAYSIFQSVLVLPIFIMNSYYPLMLKSLGGIKFVGLGLLGLSLFASGVTLFFAPLIIKVLTGGGFAGSVQSLQILSLGFPAFFLSALLMWFLISKGKYKQMLLLYTSGLIFNLTLNLIYIPAYSFYAAAWITVISEYTILVLQFMVLWFDR